MIEGGLQGLYEPDLRLLSRYRLLVHGRVHVLRQPPPESLHGDPVTRLRELVESLLPEH